ncbi:MULTISPECIES: FkbM family methyltransferase [unclassified Polaromonas]|jgi:FkbM family methyltransferase|uniref:FkbM family methyltransferase n=1 Tax=unclassified Polaromonas TaxID=2638319 RepID=UPI000BC75006|nr:MULTISPECIES: FkbM family methyltransferase [unclassified Polaromonas]OYZ76266.1 MAG: SAM-dependent methyltransferase [Polaromonas sp. 24-63-21]OZA47486.1 MAG: SAM-dependent methyltransferase [Polaromonas sp. 17-63-33]
MKTVKNNLIRTIKNSFHAMRRKFFDGYATKAYSQEGEDLILLRLFEGKRSGFYIDVGAHHPKRFSNTNLFYKLGWRGINIEPNPESFSLFLKMRPHDINIQLGVSDRTGLLKYYYFNDPALNTFDTGVVESREKLDGVMPIKTEEIPVDRLDTILFKNFPAELAIDFMTIDVEGFDYAVLQSNDWTHFRPKIILVEALRMPIEKSLDGEIHQFMKSKGYELFAKTYNTYFYSSI